MDNKTYNIVELFSGIGSQAKALKNLGINIKTVGTCEWDIHAFVAYDAIHNSVEVPEKINNMTKEELLGQLKDLSLSNNGKEPMQYKTLKTYSHDVLKRIYAAIKKTNNFVDVSKLEGKQFTDKVDIMTYSFPCQDLSNVGAFHGYNKGIDKDSGSRSSLLWQVGRLLKEMKDSKKSMPRFLLMENVPTLLSDRHKDNFELWIKELQELGYESKYFHLNASKFGLPQNRPRLLMISVYVGTNKNKLSVVNKYFSSIDEEKVVQEFIESMYYKEIKLEELLRIDYKDEKIKKEAIECTPNDTESRREIWDENPQLVLQNNEINEKYSVIRTITTKQDRNPNSGNLYFDSGIKGKSKFRYLTPRECLLFMGFSDQDYENIVLKNPEIHKNSVLFPRDKIIRMAGNSIPVKLLEGIFYQIIKIDKLLENTQNGCTRQKNKKL